MTAAISASAGKYFMSGTDLCQQASSCPDAAPPETDNFDQKSPFIRIIWLMKQPLAKEVAALGFKYGQQLASGYDGKVMGGSGMNRFGCADGTCTV